MKIAEASVKIQRITDPPWGIRQYDVYQRQLLSLETRGVIYNIGEIVKFHKICKWRRRLQQFYIYVLNDVRRLEDILLGIWGIYETVDDRIICQFRWFISSDKEPLSLRVITSNISIPLFTFFSKSFLRLWGRSERTYAVGVSIHEAGLRRCL